MTNITLTIVLKSTPIIVGKNDIYVLQSTAVHVIFCIVYMIDMGCTVYTYFKKEFNCTAYYNVYTTLLTTTITTSTRWRFRCAASAWMRFFKRAPTKCSSHLRNDARENRESKMLFSRLTSSSVVLTALLSYFNVHAYDV